MKADNFCYWLQGLMELENPETITKEQLDDIKAHLRITFKYDIDLRYGDKEHQKRLSSIHNPGSYPGAVVNC
jgi:hypothetical protein